jgi:hypothetical protein
MIVIFAEVDFTGPKVYITVVMMNSGTGLICRKEEDPITPGVLNLR